MLELSLKKSSQKFTKNCNFRYFYYVKGVPRGQIQAKYESMPGKASRARQAHITRWQPRNLPKMGRTQKFTKNLNFRPPFRARRIMHRQNTCATHIYGIARTKRSWRAIFLFSLRLKPLMRGKKEKK